MDYAASPLQALAQVLVTFPGGAGGALAFTGRGISAVTRDPASGTGQGAYIFQLDPGLPGLAGAIDPGGGALLDPSVRSEVTVRGVGAPPVSNIGEIAVAYLVSPVPGVGADRVEVTLATPAGVLSDPPGGFELVVWKGF